MTLECFAISRNTFDGCNKLERQPFLNCLAQIFEQTRTLGRSSKKSFQFARFESGYVFN